MGSFISFSTVFNQVVLRPFIDVPSTVIFIQFFTPSPSFFLTTCPYHRNLDCLIASAMSISRPILAFSSSLGILSINVTPHIHLTIRISTLLTLSIIALFISQVSLPYIIIGRTHPRYSFFFTSNLTFLFVRIGANSQNFFHPQDVLVEIAVSAPPPALNISPK